MRSPKEDITKLPQWAQNRIYVLENKISHLEKEVRIRTGIEKSRITIHDSLHDLHNPMSYVPDWNKVQFSLGDGHWDYIETTLGDHNKNYEEPYVVVRSSIGRVFVAPEAANSLRVSLKMF